MHSNESSWWGLSNGCVHIITEQTSCFCKLSVNLNRETWQWGLRHWHSWCFAIQHVLTRTACCQLYLYHETAVNVCTWYPSSVMLTESTFQVMGWENWSYLFLTLAQEHGIGVINASPISMGLLSNRGPPTWHPAGQDVRDKCREAVEYCQVCCIKWSQQKTLPFIWIVFLWNCSTCSSNVFTSTYIIISI